MLVVAMVPPRSTREVGHRPADWGVISFHTLHRASCHWVANGDRHRKAGIHGRDCGGKIAWPLVARAQQTGRVRRIGVVNISAECIAGRA